MVLTSGSTGVALAAVLQHGSILQYSSTCCAFALEHRHEQVQSRRSTDWNLKVHTCCRLHSLTGLMRC